MELSIVIPTRNRKEKLTNCLNSIFKSAKDIPLINVEIFFHNKENYEYFKAQFIGIEQIKLHMLKEYIVPEFWNMCLKNMTSDALCYLSDDVLFLEDTVQNIIEEYTTHFSDFDGILGISQFNIPSGQKVEGAFGVIGAKYADRFPNRKVWCCDYFRFFCDWEVMWYAKSINKFYFSKKARIEHLHPNFTGEIPDETHRYVRTFWKKDKITYERRIESRCLWGKDFNLINKKETK